MNKAQLAEAIAQKSGISKVDAKKSIDALIAVASDALKSGDKITLTGLGSFVVAKKAGGADDASDRVGVGGGERFAKRRGRHPKPSLCPKAHA